MTLDGVQGPLVYLAILAAAVVEGEVVFVLAGTLVAQGSLNPLGVIVAGAIGAAAGDQFYFYLFRGRLERWVGRFPSIARRAEPLVARVRRHAAAMVMLIRFAPGLRIAMAAACAYADVSPWLFSSLNAATAFVWAAGLLALIAWAGPAWLAALGLAGWQAALIMGVVALAILQAVGWLERRYFGGVR